MRILPSRVVFGEFSGERDGKEVRNLSAGSSAGVFGAADDFRDFNRTVLDLVLDLSEAVEAWDAERRSEPWPFASIAIERYDIPRRTSRSPLGGQV